MVSIGPKDHSVLLRELLGMAPDPAPSRVVPGPVLGETADVRRLREESQRMRAQVATLRDALRVVRDALANTYWGVGLTNDEQAENDKAIGAADRVAREALAATDPEGA